MATKLYNSHLKIILEASKSNYILDTYIALVHISSDIKGKYLIQTFDSSKRTVISLLKNIVTFTPKTIYNCFSKLIDLEILAYDENLKAWILCGMENMTKAKDAHINTIEDTLKCTGYTNIRKFYLTSEFSNMKGREKRLLIFMSQLSDSKNSKFHKGFSINLLKSNSVWLEIINTKSKYYAKYTIEKLLFNYKELFENKTESLRFKDPCPDATKNFKFAFNCVSIENKNTEDDNIESVKLKNPKEHLLVIEMLSFCNVTLTKQKIMHITRAISTLKHWFLKERVVQIIVNKYIAIKFHKSRVDISSLPSYIAAVVRSVLLEYINFKASPVCNDISKHKAEILFENTSKNENCDILNKSIEASFAKLSF
ncbi:MAG: hypothetical protein ACRC68_18735 [Clostridium sp.]